MASVSLPKFVDYGGLTTVPSPYVNTGTTLYCFMLEADMDKLRAFCKQVFSDPSGGKVEYVPLTRFVMMTVGNIEKLVPRPDLARPAGSPPYESIGYSSEAQVAFWMFTAAVKREGPVVIAQRPAVFVPYIFVHNAFSMACGREVEGYAKNWGWFEFPDEANKQTPPPPLDDLKLDCWGLKEYNPDSMVSRIPLLEIGCGEANPATQNHSGWNSLHDLFQDIKNLIFDPDGRGSILLPGLKMAENLFEDVKKHQLPEVFLKQYRDVTNAEAACYQAIVETRNTIKSFTGFPLAHKYNFKLQDVASHPLGAQLGLNDQQAALSFWIRMDFNVENGSVIWQAPTGEPRGCLPALLGKLLGR